MWYTDFWHVTATWLVELHFLVLGKSTRQINLCTRFPIKWHILDPVQESSIHYMVVIVFIIKYYLWSGSKSSQLAKFLVWSISPPQRAPKNSKSLSISNIPQISHAQSTVSWFPWNIFIKNVCLMPIYTCMCVYLGYKCAEYEYLSIKPTFIDQYYQNAYYLQ